VTGVSSLNLARCVIDARAFSFFPISRSPSHEVLSELGRVSEILLRAALVRRNNSVAAQHDRCRISSSGLLRRQGNRTWNSHHRRFAARPADEPPRRQGAKKSLDREGAGDGFDPSEPWLLGVLAVHSAASPGFADDRSARGRCRLGEPVKEIPGAIPLHVTPAPSSPPPNSPI